jgi:hypothetical protein
MKINYTENTKSLSAQIDQNYYESTVYRCHALIDQCY